jgi:hypothetical protein
VAGNWRGAAWARARRGDRPDRVPDDALSRSRAFGEIYGYLFTALVVGSSVGQFLGDVGFDRLGSYTPALIGYTVALLTAAVLVNRLGPYAYLPQRRISPELRPPRVSAGRRGLPICER